MEEKSLDQLLVEAKAKVYDLNGMKNTIEQQINLGNRTIADLANKIAQNNAQKDPRAEKSAEATANPVAATAGANEPGGTANAAKPANGGATAKGKGKPSANNAKGNSK